MFSISGYEKKQKDGRKMERKESKRKEMMERETEDETHSKDLGDLSFLCHALSGKPQTLS